MKLKAALFDLDGVLLDTEGIYSDFWHGIDLEYPTGIEDFAHYIKGSTLSTILDRHFPPEVHTDIRARLSAFERSMPYRLFDGAADLLTSLKSHGIATAIVTSSNREKMRRVFREVPVLATVDTLVVDEDVTASKPDPQGYMLAARRLNALPSAFAVVEDSLHGLEAGRRSGGLVVGIATTNPRQVVEPLSDYVADTVAGIADFLMRDN